MMSRFASAGAADSEVVPLGDAQRLVEAVGERATVGRIGQLVCTETELGCLGRFVCFREQPLELAAVEHDAELHSHP
jgi:hypothetical protein